MRLHGRWLIAARAVWIAIAALAIGIFVTGIPQRYAELQQACVDAACGDELGQLTPGGVQALIELGISLRSYALYTVAVGVATATVYRTVGVLIFWRRSHDRMALLVALLLVLSGATLTTSDVLAAQPGWWLLVNSPYAARRIGCHVRRVSKAT